MSYVYAKSVSVAPDGDDNLYYLVDGVWTVEVIAPLISDVVGTIVRDKDGDAWQRQERGWYMTNDYNPFPLDHVQRACQYR